MAATTLPDFILNFSIFIQLSTQEQKDIVDGFSHPDKVQASGVRLAGQKFFALQANGDVIYGKKQVRVPS